MNDNKHPSVSVIIPAYNREHTIRLAIQSVLQQTFHDFEIIVIDDGSADQTLAIVKGINDPRIRYMRHKRNRGAGAARNTGIKVARGEYLAFLDSDDEWLPDKLDRQIALLADPSAGWQLSCSGFFIVVNDSQQEYIHAQTSSWFKRLHWTCDLSPGTTLVLHRKCLAKVGLLDEKFPRLEDWDWLLRLSKLYKLVVVDKPLARVHRGTLPTADAVETSIRLFLSKHDQDFSTFGVYYRRRVISKHLLGIAYWFYREKRFLRGSRYLFKAFYKNPLQNPIRLIGLFFSVVDALLQTSIIPWALKRKQQLLRR